MFHEYPGYMYLHLQSKTANFRNCVSKNAKKYADFHFAFNTMQILSYFYISYNFLTLLEDSVIFYTRNFGSEKNISCQTQTYLLFLVFIFRLPVKT